LIDCNHCTAVAADDQEYEYQTKEIELSDLNFPVVLNLDGGIYILGALFSNRHVVFRELWELKHWGSRGFA
jgi:hypothetical protein